MNTKTLGMVGLFFSVGLLFAAFLYLTVRSLPKKLDVPQRWTQEVNRTGIVSRVSTKGVKVVFPDGKEWYFSGESGLTNRQPVFVHVAVSYVRYYDDPLGRGAVELVQRTINPLSYGVTNSP